MPSDLPKFKSLTPSRRISEGSSRLAKPNPGQRPPLLSRVLDKRHHPYETEYSARSIKKKSRLPVVQETTGEEVGETSAGRSGFNKTHSNIDSPSSPHLSSDLDPATPNIGQSQHSIVPFFGNNNYFSGDGAVDQAVSRLPKRLRDEEDADGPDFPKRPRTIPGFKPDLPKIVLKYRSKDKMNQRSRLRARLFRRMTRPPQSISTTAGYTQEDVVEPQNQEEIASNCDHQEVPAASNLGNNPHIDEEVTLSSSSSSSLALAGHPISGVNGDDTLNVQIPSLDVTLSPNPDFLSPIEASDILSAQISQSATVAPSQYRSPIVASGSRDEKMDINFAEAVQEQNSDKGTNLLALDDKWEDGERTAEDDQKLAPLALNHTDHWLAQSSLADNETGPKSGQLLISVPCNAMGNVNDIQSNAESHNQESESEQQEQEHSQEEACTLYAPWGGISKLESDRESETETEDFTPDPESQRFEREGSVIGIGDRRGLELGQASHSDYRRDPEIGQDGQEPKPEDGLEQEKHDEEPGTFIAPWRGISSLESDLKLETESAEKVYQVSQPINRLGSLGGIGSNEALESGQECQAEEREHHGQHSKPVEQEGEPDACHGQDSKPVEQEGEPDACQGEKVFGLAPSNGFDQHDGQQTDERNDTLTDGHRITALVVDDLQDDDDNKWNDTSSSDTDEEMKVSGGLDDGIRDEDITTENPSLDGRFSNVNMLENNVADGHWNGINRQNHEDDQQPEVITGTLTNGLAGDNLGDDNADWNGIITQDTDVEMKTASGPDSGIEDDVPAADNSGMDRGFSNANLQANDIIVDDRSGDEEETDDTDFADDENASDNNEDEVDSERSKFGDRGKGILGSAVYRRLKRHPSKPCRNKHMAMVMEMIANTASQPPFPARRERLKKKRPRVFNVPRDDNVVKSNVRDFASTLLGEEPWTVPSDKELEDFTRSRAREGGPTSESFRLDLGRIGISSPWNKKAAQVFAEAFLASKAYESTDRGQIEDVFLTHLVTLHKHYQGRLKTDSSPQIQIQERDKKKVNAHDQRRRGLFKRRKETCSHYSNDPSIQYLLDEFWPYCTPDIMSGDETDHNYVPVKKEKKVIISILDWRSPEAVQFFHTLDGLYMSTRFTLDGRVTAGRFPDERAPSYRVETGIAVTGLPRNIYNPAWLATLNQLEIAQLNMRPSIKLEFSQNILRIAARYLHIENRRSVPLPRDHPAIANILGPGCRVLTLPGRNKEPAPTIVASQSTPTQSGPADPAVHQPLRIPNSKARSSRSKRQRLN